MVALHCNPNAGHLWAYAQGAWPDVDVESGALVAPTAAFGKAYAHQVAEASAGRIPKVDLSGSGGVSWVSHTTDFIDVEMR